MKENCSEVNRKVGDQMLLAGDIGGTTSRLGVFQKGATRPSALFRRTYATPNHHDVDSLLAAFMRDAGLEAAAIDAVCLGVAGPVVDGRATLTNVPWRIDVGELTAHLGRPRVAVVNDLHATAAAMPSLLPEELQTLQTGEVDTRGPLAVIAAGTGLGEATVHQVGGRWYPLSSEAGHADFAPRTEEQVQLWRALRDCFGRATVEHVVSGPGLVVLHRLAHETRCAVVDVARAGDVAAETVAAALNGRCPACARALGIFIDAYGAEAGNMALRALPTAGLFIAGGIAPKLLPVLADGRFMHAFLDKAPMESVVARVPVHVVLHPYVGLLGAAICARAISI